ncbi:MAG: hypothetical protein HQL26_05795 [Candidatus Omnitrophica bacterium]|nr:hypothetical protein [Candidatus Omnitrophota bacterium]
MAYKQEVIDCLENMVDAQNEVIKHFARQDILLMIMPQLIKQTSADETRNKLKDLQDDAEVQRGSVETLLNKIKEEDRDVY